MHITLAERLSDVADRKPRRLAVGCIAIRSVALKRVLRMEIGVVNIPAFSTRRFLSFCGFSVSAFSVAISLSDAAAPVVRPSVRPTSVRNTLKHCPQVQFVKLYYDLDRPSLKVLRSRRLSGFCCNPD